MEPTPALVTSTASVTGNVIVVDERVGCPAVRLAEVLVYEIGHVPDALPTNGPKSMLDAASGVISPFWKFTSMYAV